MKVIKVCSFLFLLLFSFCAFAFTPNFVTYWQNFNNPAETPVRLTEIPQAYNVVIIAFADLSSDGTVGFTLEGPPYTANDMAEFISDIKTLQSKGVKVLLSLGGQNGIFSVNDPTAEAKFVSTAETVISQLGVDGLDYDIENGLTTANVTYLVDATKQIKSDFAAKGKNLIFTAAPETLDTYFQIYPHGKYDALIQSGVLDLVQVQLYNSGCMPGDQPGSPCYPVGTEDFAVSQADSTIRAWQAGNISNATQKYVLGFPASKNAAGSGYMDPTIINKALVCLRTGKSCDTYVPDQTYPEIGGVMDWDVNWDAKDKYQFSQTIEPCLLKGEC